MVKKYFRARRVIGIIVLWVGFVSLLLMSSPLDKKLSGDYRWTSDLAEWGASILFFAFLIFSTLSLTQMQFGRMNKKLPIFALLCYLGSLTIGYFSFHVNKSSILSPVGYAARSIIFGVWPFVCLIDLALTFSVKKGA